jgi:NurA-like 5'-3' nuclease
MEENAPKLNFEELKEIQNSFEDSIKVIERHVAESISNKNEITLIKKDLLDANNKFNQALDHLDELKNSIDFEDKIYTK